MEDYFFDINDNIEEDKIFVLIIYDIIDNKKRTQFAKYLQSYGFRVQKSAFEALIKKKAYRKLIEDIEQYVSDEDSIRVYKINGKAQIRNFGKEVSEIEEEVIII
ncbi:MAG: CRISPR-associated endonuclease Cas2 [Clostridium sp.]|nr:CRISPR-associated endonuclease Cas2 [Clostridium sp.]